MRRSALGALAGTLAPHTGWRRLNGRLEVGLSDAMATALTAAALQSALFAGLARAGLHPSAVPGTLQVVPRFGRAAGVLHLDAAATVRALWLALAFGRALWAVWRTPLSAEAPQPRVRAVRRSSRRARSSAPSPGRLSRRGQGPHSARASSAFA